MKMKSIDSNSGNVLEGTIISMSFLILKFYENEAQRWTSYFAFHYTINNLNKFRSYV